MSVELPTVITGADCGEGKRIDCVLGPITTPDPDDGRENTVPECVIGAEPGASVCDPITKCEEESAVMAIDPTEITPGGRAEILTGSGLLGIFVGAPATPGTPKKLALFCPSGIWAPPPKPF